LSLLQNKAPAGSQAPSVMTGIRWTNGVHNSWLMLAAFALGARKLAQLVACPLCLFIYMHIQHRL
jgi:hypothetical protein